MNILTHLTIFFGFSVFATNTKKSLEGIIGCDKLDSDEIEKAMEQGRCNPHQERNNKKEKKINAFKAGAKKIMLKFVFIGKKRVFTQRLDEKYRRLGLAEGVFLELSCPGVNMKNRENASWWFNGERIEEYFLDWRVQVGADGLLLLSPVLPEDTGNFECFYNDQHMGILFINVESLKMTLLDGYLNFLVISSISFGFLLIIAVYKMCTIKEGDDLNQ